MTPKTELQGRDFQDRGFARPDMAAVARRQLHLSLGLVAMIAAATLAASFGLRTSSEAPVNAAKATSQFVYLDQTRG